MRNWQATATTTLLRSSSAWVLAWALLLGACGDGREPLVGPSPDHRPMLAIGTDPVSGATIETNQDEYLPGEIVHVTGQGWGAGETVRLNMKEEPDTHEDVTVEVLADATGAFSVHFYDVQEHDLGVTFTLTATGLTSGSVATATFTDGNIKFTTFPVNLLVSVQFDQWNSNTTCTGAATSTANTLAYNTGHGLNTGRSIKVYVPAVSGYNYTGYSNPDGLTILPASSSSATELCIAGTAPATFQAFVLNFEESSSTNHPPVVSAGGPYSGNEGAAINISGTASDADNDPLTTTWSYTAGAGVDPTATCSFGNANLLNTTVTCTDNGSYTLHLTADDGNGGQTTVNASLAVANVAPSATFNAPSSVNEGSDIDLSLTGPSDPSSVDVTAGFEYAFDCGAGYGTWSGTSTASCATVDDGIKAVKGKIRDKDLGEREYSANVTVYNVPPSISSLTLSPDLGLVYPISQPVTVTAAWTDPGVLDTQSCQAVATAAGVTTVNGSTGSSAAGGSGNCSSVLSFIEAGVYTVTVTVTDKDNGTTTATIMFVVYDPSAGFVTGGGWINSPAGAYTVDATLMGKATFGFVSKYKKGATVPEGNTEFVFHAAGMNFHSGSYQWLVVNQAGTNAQFKGTGTLNGQAGFGFMLWATDGATDTFRIKIWRGTDETDVVYDNGALQALGGGSIVIQTGGNGKK